MPAGPSVDSAADESVTPLVRKTAAWAWRLLVILAAIVALLWVVTKVELIVVPVALATMLTALLLPAVDFLHRRFLPRGVAVALVLLGGIAIVGGILSFVITQFIEGVPALAKQVTASIEGVSNEQVGAQILTLQTQLQASLQTTALLSKLSIVNFIPA